MVQVKEMPSTSAENASDKQQNDLALSSSSKSPLPSDLEVDECEDMDAIMNESIFDRIKALQDIVPYETRSTISKTISTIGKSLWTGAKLAGNVAWVVTTSAMVLVVPLMFEIEKEQAMVLWEQEQQMQQQGAQQLLQPSQNASAPQAK